MNRRPRSLVLLLLFLALAGCASSSSSPSSSASRPSSSGPPRVRCLTDSGRDSASTSRPLFFLFCAESP